MINATEIRELQRQIPFQPFTLHMSDGRSIEVVHPEQFLVFPNKVIVALGEKDGLPERSESCSILHITSLVQAEK